MIFFELLLTFGLMAGLIYVIVKVVLKAILTPINENAKQNFRAKLYPLNTQINEVHTKVLGNGEYTPAQKLDRLWSYAQNTVRNTKRDYVSNNKITKTADTHSDLGCAGVSSTHFHARFDPMDSNRYDALFNAGNLKDKYAKVDDFIEYGYPKAELLSSQQIDQIVAGIREILPLYTKLKQVGCKTQALSVKLDDLLYYKIEGSVQRTSNVTGGGVNMQGAIAGAIIGGSAAAIIGSQIGTETTTQTVTYDDRKITLYINEHNHLETMAIRCQNADKTIAALRELIPSKEESVVRIEASKQSNAKASPSSADELKKYKELLDSGIITQEEFDAKKKQLLGL